MSYLSNIMKWNIHPPNTEVCMSDLKCHLTSTFGVASSNLPRKTRKT